MVISVHSSWEALKGPSSSWDFLFRFCFDRAAAILLCLGQDMLYYRLLHSPSIFSWGKGEKGAHPSMCFWGAMGAVCPRQWAVLTSVWEPTALFWSHCFKTLPVVFKCSVQVWCPLLRLHQVINDTDRSASVPVVGKNWSSVPLVTQMCWTVTSSHPEAAVGCFPWAVLSWYVTNCHSYQGLCLAVCQEF